MAFTGKLVGICSDWLCSALMSALSWLCDMSGGCGNYSDIRRLYGTGYRTILFRVVLILYTVVPFLLLRRHRDNGMNYDYTALLSADFVCSLVMGLFMRSVYRYMSAMYRRKKASMR